MWRMGFQKPEKGCHQPQFHREHGSTRDHVIGLVKISAHPRADKVSQCPCRCSAVSSVDLSLSGPGRARPVGGALVNAATKVGQTRRRVLSSAATATESLLYCTVLTYVLM